VHPVVSSRGRVCTSSEADAGWVRLLWSQRAEPGAPEQLLKERKLADLVERDEYARVGYDDSGHESMDACSAAQSSLVIWK